MLQEEEGGRGKSGRRRKRNISVLWLACLCINKAFRFLYFFFWPSRLFSVTISHIFFPTSKPDGTFANSSGFISHVHHENRNLSKKGGQNFLSHRMCVNSSVRPVANRTLSQLASASAVLLVQQACKSLAPTFLESGGKQLYAP